MQRGMARGIKGRVNQLVDLPLLVFYFIFFVFCVLFSE